MYPNFLIFSQDKRCIVKNLVKEAIHVELICPFLNRGQALKYHLPQANDYAVLSYLPLITQSSLTPDSAQCQREFMSQGQV